jgi:transposase
MTQRIQIRYSQAFQRQVVSDLEAGRFSSVQSAQQHYGIGGNGTIGRWLRRHGRNHLLPKVVRVEKPNEADEIRQLRKRNQELEKALGRMYLRSELNEAFLIEACKALGTDVDSFKKKHVIRPSEPPASGPTNR